MPRVKDEYLAKRRSFILECTAEVLKEKPLSQITMRDIINKAELSQGAIYRYYANLDEVFVDFINSHTPDTPLEQVVDELLISEQDEKNVLTQCLIALGDYIAELLKSTAGKTFFELLALYSADPEKRDGLLTRLKFRQSLEYTQSKIMEFTLAKVEEGVFQPQIPVRSILLFASAFIDGIALEVTLNTTDASPSTDIPEMFQALAKFVINLLEE